MRTRLFTVATPILAFLLAAPHYAGQSQTYLLRVRLKPGAKMTYSVNMNMDLDTSNMPKPQGQTAPAMPKTMKMTMAMNYTNVLQKFAGGKYTWKMTINSASMTTNMGAQVPDSMKDLKGKTATLVTDERGKVLSVDGDAKMGLQSIGSGGMTGVVFPEKAVGIGSTWKDTTTAQGMSVTVQYKLAGTKPIANGTGLVLHSTIVGNQMITTPQPFQSVINAKTGELMSSSGKAKMNMMGMAGSMNFNLARK